MVEIFLADGFEEIEALTPVDYLRRCDIPVTVVGVSDKTITGAHGIAVICDSTTEEQRPMPDMVILPGGMPGTRNLEHCRTVIERVRQCYEKGGYVAAICAAPSILGHMGLLHGKKATCYPGFETELADADFKADPVVVDGKLITARGAGCANQFAFALVEALLGRDKAEQLRASIIWA